MKTVQIRPRTDTHDLETKLGRARSFLERGDKVKLVMRMRGRERSFPQRWVETMRDHFDEHLADVGQIASRPTQQGHLVSMMVEPA